MMLGLFLFIIGIVAIVVLVAFNVRWLYMAYAGLSAILFMVYLAIDIQLIMGGRKYEISPEDYIFAAIQLFLDIIIIFWYLLAIFGGGRK
uniref:Uncharacterized protein n=1 Tax=Acrobeloides nanus TaxID=290746 RepID=A0A914EAB4_9BILA